MGKINIKTKKIIEQNPIAFATIDSLNNPNVIGVAYVKVVEKDKILITDNYMKQTRENILKNKNVCLAVWNKDWNGYKITGKAEYFESGKWKKYVEDMTENKGFPCKGAIVVNISKIIELG